MTIFYLVDCNRLVINFNRVLYTALRRNGSEVLIC